MRRWLRFVSKATSLGEGLRVICIDAHTDMLRYVLICSDMLQYVLICSDMLCSDMLRYAMIYADIHPHMFWYMQICIDTLQLTSGAVQK